MPRRSHTSRCTERTYRLLCLQYAKEADDLDREELLTQADIFVLGIPGIGKTTVCKILAWEYGLKAVGLPVVLFKNSLVAVGAHRQKYLLNEKTKNRTALVVGLQCSAEEVVNHRAKREGFLMAADANDALQGWQESEYIKVKDEQGAQARLYRELCCYPVDMKDATPAKLAEEIARRYLKTVAPIEAYRLVPAEPTVRTTYAKPPQVPATN